MITWLLGSAACVYAWYKSGWAPWLFMAGVNAGFAFDSLIISLDCKTCEMVYEEEIAEPEYQHGLQVWRESVEIEAIAAQCHEQWAGWTTHLLGKMSISNGQCVLGNVWLERWTRQVQTLYADLTEEEKESDRREARKIVAAIELSRSES